MKYFKAIFIFFFLVSCSKDETSINDQFALTTEVQPAEGGVVSPSEGNYESGAKVELHAQPANGYRFVSWQGDLSGSDNPAEVIFNENKDITAVFEKAAAESIVIYSINDPHGKINNFARIKAVIEKEKETESQVFFVCGGDIFSGNPIVDYHPEKGSPIVDLMGKAGMDVSVIGNHEFDYGQEILNNRMEQASFPFLLANVSKGSGELNMPQGQVNIEKDGFNIAFIGVVETGSPDHTPLTHPKKVTGLEFSEGVEAVGAYEDNEDVKNADLVVALTHYGQYGDRQILQQHDFIDLVIGGHNHMVYSEKVAGRYMVQSGSDLKYLTKLSLDVRDGEILDYEYELIDLNEIEILDEALQEEISEYNNIPELFVEIGTSLQDHTYAETACFYTDALRTITGADLVFQNYGGIRAGLDYGSITPFDIYTIDPFGNGLDTFEMTVGELKTFFDSGDAPALAYSGVKMERRNGNTVFRDSSGKVLADDMLLTVALNDYISNVYPVYFGAPVRTYEKTTAEYIIDYLEQYQSEINYGNCERSSR
ncbi:InlB B-repeat-containing protein [Salinimicrobium sp. GXAS 041]|uniref:InlB B-repeat-containing protein n=1 Tax=Salinimicrobium sp. GXAS 041 TaxID=3400806 RepID=UPI003C737A4A